jgi:hypothetical protein
MDEHDARTRGTGRSRLALRLRARDCAGELPRGSSEAGARVTFGRVEAHGWARRDPNEPIDYSETASPSL